MAEDRHRYPARAFRPEPDEIRPAEERLGANRVGAYLRACLRWLRSDPDAALAAVADHWPPERPTGRPPRTSGGLRADHQHASPHDDIPSAERDTPSDHDAAPAAGE